MAATDGMAATAMDPVCGSTFPLKPHRWRQAFGGTDFDVWSETCQTSGVAAAGKALGQT